MASENILAKGTEGSGDQSGKALHIKAETGADAGAGLQDWLHLEDQLTAKPLPSAPLKGTRVMLFYCLVLLVLFVYGAAPLAVLSGNLITRLSDPNRAIAVFDLVLNFCPDDFNALAGRAAAYRAAGQYPRSLADWNKLVENHPGATSARAARADLLSFLKHDREALNDLHIVSVQDPSLALAYQRQAFATVYARGDTDEVVRLSTLALAVDPALPKSYANRAAGYLRQGHYDLAISDATSGLAQKPDQSTTVSTLYAVRAESYCAIDQLDKAIADARSSIKAEPVARTYRALTLYYLESHDYSGALATIIEGQRQVDTKDTILQFLKRQVYISTSDPRLAKAYKPAGFSAIKVSEYFLDRADFYLEGKNYKHALLSSLIAATATPGKNNRETGTRPCLSRIRTL